ncbi:molybdopterin cofactor-binding domain-containing protein [Paenibacillus elgii]
MLFLEKFEYANRRWSGSRYCLNSNGSVNLLCGAVEIGQGTRTVLTQLLAERLRMDDRMIHISTDVNTEKDPHHWKTVASRRTSIWTGVFIGRADSLETGRNGSGSFNP